MRQVVAERKARDGKLGVFWHTQGSDKSYSMVFFTRKVHRLLGRLWSSADNLRANSNYASNEYFLPVMGLIFLRHAFSRITSTSSPSSPTWLPMTTASSSRPCRWCR